MTLQPVRPVIHSEHLIAAYLIFQSSSIHSQNYRKIFTELSLCHHKNKYTYAWTLRLKKLAWRYKICVSKLPKACLIGYIHHPMV